MKYTVIYEKGPNSWGAYIPDLPGAIAVGGTRHEVEVLIRKAVSLQLKGMREEGQTVLEPASFAGEVEVPR